MPRFSTPAVDIQVVSVQMFYMAAVFLLLSPMFVIDTVRSRAHIRSFKTRVEDSIMIFALVCLVDYFIYLEVYTG